jgi:hypothetical protein
MRLAAAPRAPPALRAGAALPTALRGRHGCAPGAATRARRSAAVVVAGNDRAFSAARALTLPLRGEHATFPVEHYLQARRQAFARAAAARSATRLRARGHVVARSHAAWRAAQNAERVVHLSFPDAHRRQRLSPDTWRVHLLPLQARHRCRRRCCVLGTVQPAAHRNPPGASM